ncbi:MAG: carbonic anhydrase, partial [Betaproteobacteria bacterium]|nr:carbonic anhydrase [Betaproteobacteria bacterium]
VCQTTIVRDAWERGQDVAVHGWIYGLRDGLLRDLGVTVASTEEAAAASTTAAETVKVRSSAHRT